MLADRISMSVFQPTKKDDPLGTVGSQNLILGNSMAGYFGTVNGLITNTQLTNLMSMTSGTLLDATNTDITFHKFIHKGRILLIPSRPIKHSISWDNIQSKDGVKGKVITIDGQMYLCRLMTGSRHYYTNNPSIAGGEWEDLIVNFKDLTLITPLYINICQEVKDESIYYRIGRGDYTSLLSLTGVHFSSIDVSGYYFSWLPILEVL